MISAKFPRRIGAKDNSKPGKFIIIKTTMNMQKPSYGK